MTNNSTKDTRKHYGPLAEQLIGPVTYGKGAKLDEAIGKLLIERDQIKEQLDAENSELEELRRATPAGPGDDRLSAAVADQTKAIRMLCEAVSLENKMTRLLFGSVMTSTGNEDVQLHEMAERVIDDLYQNSTLLDSDQRDEIARKQEVAIIAARQEMERAPVEMKEMEDPELDR